MYDSHPQHIEHGKKKILNNGQIGMTALMLGLPTLNTQSMVREKS